MQETPMVSTRGIRHKFSIGERVLCYEPDPTKAKVLYDSKVLGIVETKDKRGRKITQYKIHFQGWNPSWDRRVNSDYVLKDTEENRQLQKDLAEKAQLLHLPSHLYRRESKKHNRKESNTDSSSPKNRNRGSIEDAVHEDSSCSTFEKTDGDYSNRDEQIPECDSESYSSSVESYYEEDRVMIKVGEKLKNYLELDYEMIVNQKKLHDLPSQMPAITILENFVKQSAIKLIFCTSQNDSARKRNPHLRPERREKDLDKISNTIPLLKEVADGLRIYLDFTLKDYLLYNEEKEQADLLLSEENLQGFSYVPLQLPSFDFLNFKGELTDSVAHSITSESTTVETNQQNENTNKTESQQTNVTHQQDDNGRRKLRSHRNEENDNMFIDFNFSAASSSKQDNCFSSIASTTSSGSSTPLANFTTTNPHFLKTISSTNIPFKIREFLNDVFSWQILPSNAEPQASMIYGATHLARLIVKLPDFLNASAMPDEKLKVLLQHLDIFVAFLEGHKEWFTENNYKEKII